MTSQKSIHLSVLINLFLVGVSVNAAVWLTYRYDNARTACPFSAAWKYSGKGK